MNQDFGSPTHYVITFNRSGLATLYKNGNSVATVDISATSAIDIGSDTTPANIPSRIGTSGTDGVIGTFYRFRTWNKLLSNTEVQTAFDRADVPKIDQYGDKANLLLGVDKTLATAAANTAAFNAAYGWQSTASTSTVVASNVLTITSNAGGGIYKQVYRNGKNVRFTLNVTAISGTWRFLPSAGGDATDITTTGIKQLTALQVDNEVRFYSNSAGASISIDASSTNLELAAVGAVADIDLAFANPLQSLTVQNRAGLPDGEASSSTLVTQVQPIIQGNLTSLVVGTGVGTPADGQIIVDGKAASAPSYSFEHTTATGMYSPGANKINFSTASTDRLKIDGSGNVTVEGPKLEVTDDLSTAHTILKLKNTNAAAGYGSQIQLEDHDSKYYISIVDNDLKFFNGATTTVNFANSGLATFSNGIAFSQTDASGTGITSGNATLNHYEEGTFTLTDASGGTGTAPVNAGGHYTRIGNRVFISVSFQMPTQSDGQTMNLAGLPFPVVNNEDAVGLVLNYSTKSGIVYARTIKNTSNIFFYNASGGAVTNATASAGEFYINGHYQF
jgi:hypothetical protein